MHFANVFVKTFAACLFKQFPQMDIRVRYYYTRFYGMVSWWYCVIILCTDKMEAQSNHFGTHLFRRKAVNRVCLSVPNHYVIILEGLKVLPPTKNKTHPYTVYVS